jgi:hypothetical protein
MGEQDPFRETDRPIYQPLCPTCGRRMWFMKVSKLDNAHDIRTFKCHLCAHAETETVTVDADH